MVLPERVQQARGGPTASSHGRAEDEGELEIGSRPEELARRYARLIRSAVFRVAGAAAAQIADDVEQKVLVELFRQLDAAREIRHPASYLYRVAVRETVRALRGEARAERCAAAAADLPPAAAPDPARELERRETAAQIAAALATLADDRRRAAQAHLAGFTVTEIEAMFGWDYNRARNLIARGLADLRRALRARGVDG